MQAFGIVGWKNSGKTHLMVRLVGQFVAEGVRVSIVKHAHHDFDLDQPGKDSYRHRTAGAEEVLVASARRFGLIREHRGGPEPGLEALLARMDPVPLVLVEGFKSETHPKLEVTRQGLEGPLIADSDHSIVALAADYRPELDRPVLPLEDTAGIAAFILKYCGLR